MLRAFGHRTATALCCRALHGRGSAASAAWKGEVVRALLPPRATPRQLKPRLRWCSGSGSRQPPRHRGTPSTSSGGVGKTAAEVDEAARISILENLQTQWKAAYREQLFQQFAGQWLVFGAIGGAAGMLGYLYFYVEKNPWVIEALLVQRAEFLFSASTQFDDRVAAYNSLPDFNIALPDPEEVFALAETAASGDAVADDPFALEAQWAERVGDGLATLQNSKLIRAKARMRSLLVAECMALDGGVNRQLDALRDVLPPSLEFKLVVRELLEHASVRTKWLPVDVLNSNMAPTDTGPHDTTMRALILALSTYPGRANRMVLFLTGHIALDELCDDGTPAQLKKAFGLVKSVFGDFSSDEQQSILQLSLANAIGGITRMRRPQGVAGTAITPYDLYVRAIDSELVSPLGRDARVTGDILAEVKTIFLELPADIQARILLCAIQHPTNVNLMRHGAEFAASLDAEAQAEIVRDLMAAGGVVAVKLGQMLAEDPKVPADYRKLLGSLRDSNPPMAATEFWGQVPPTVRTKIVRLGPRLGTGSVKQVHLAELMDGTHAAVGVLRDGVEYEALASVDALETSEQLGTVVNKLARLMYGEFNLFQEGETLIEFATSPIGRHPLFDVVPVRHHSPRCLVEGVAAGRSIPKALADPSTREAVREVLTEYHRAVFRTFSDYGLIHSDIHLGNAIYGKVASGRDGFLLFDVGQFERASQKEVIALLWLLAAISSPERTQLLRETAITNLDTVSELRPDAPSITVARAAAKGGVLPREATPFERLDLALDEALSPMDDGSLPDKKTAYMLFLRAAENRGVDLPAGAFAVAKMLDGMMVQQVEYALPPVVDQSVEEFLWHHMSWADTSRIIKTSLYNILPLADWR